MHPHNRTFIPDTVSGTLTMGTRETLASRQRRKAIRVCAALKREPQFEKEPPSISEVFACFKHMCAALRREPHVEKGAAPIREALAL
eukprot:2279680-Pyramimonas_sp.AAC.1